ncbi:ribonucleoside hydrolase RihC [Liquorilactobacillus sicerae]|uniref:ribonucleoside hydrolase RihC n=1 Tax=Liquorilactobacillus sicerae TaxID=1416943 RepID=UPI00248090C8|nr:ribonucleoside hydrolase RihC [Liquorilactobacillus sicerae]
MEKMPLILDMDPGVDDAVALAVAVNNPVFDVKLITSVAGNVNVDKTTRNELKLLQFLDKTEIPVARGAAQPLKKKFEDAAYIHGQSGLPGYDFPSVTLKPDPRPAVKAIYQTLKQAPAPMTIVATGAYTNIAELLLRYPEIKAQISRLILMGGSISGGNVSSVAEFNIYTDPDAAKIVYQSGLPIVMIGLDVTLQALVTWETLKKLAALGKTGTMLYQLITAYQDIHPNGKPLHDVNTIFYLLHPEAIETKNYQIDVVTQGPAIGATVADIQNRWSHGQTNAKVGVNIDADYFNQWLLAEVSQMVN